MNRRTLATAHSDAGTLASEPSPVKFRVSSPSSPLPFVSRAGLKLAHALDAFSLDVRGRRCADFGCNVGGFTDCLLQRGAAHVTAIDTGYGALAWKLRQDPRVTTLERTNALHVPPPTADQRPDFIAIDLGWTPQRLCVPAALGWLAPGGDIVTLIKPHYEAGATEKALMTRGVLPPELAEPIARRVAEHMPEFGARVLALTESPIEGGGGKGNQRGNREWLAHVQRASS